MESLKYVIEDHIIAEILGRQNFTNKEGAVLEIVKNAYDAGASCLSISFFSDVLEFVDNGEGMDEHTIKSNWMHVGISTRDYQSEDGKRILAGAKGVGRFALARLADNVHIISKKKGSEAISWKSNWDESSIDTTTFDAVSGTVIRLSNLRDKWNKNAISNLIDYLSVVYRSDDMAINIIDLEGNASRIKFKFSSPQIGINYYSSISFSYDSHIQKLNVSIKCDEFSYNIKNDYKDLEFSNYNGALDMCAEIGKKDASSKKIDYDENSNALILTEIGSFSGELFFYTSHIIKNSEESGIYKEKSLPEHFDSGVVLYRNSFSTAGCDGKIDWLGLNARSRKSPASPRHPTGAWKVRANQISGYVVIDKRENAKLKELSNRQGFEHDEYYNAFIFIITSAINEFERFRQDILRRILKNSTEVVSLPLMESIGQGKKQISNLSQNEKIGLKNEISSALKQINNLKVGIEDKRYELQLLNTFATIGLRATSTAHEYKNSKNNISTDCHYIRETLKELNMWDTITRPEYTQYKSTNIPLLLDEAEDITKKIERFINVILDDTEKSKFLKPEDIGDILKNIKNNWEYDYSSLTIVYSIVGEQSYQMTGDKWGTILDNLILNSVQQNPTSHLIVNIECKFTNNSINVKYVDNGVGLNVKYKNNPLRILEVNETTRENGHGIGMWLVNNTITETGGSVDNIKAQGPGFEIAFHLGGGNHGE